MTEEVEDDGLVSLDQGTTCPDCDELIDQDATVCPHCDALLDLPDPAAVPERRWIGKVVVGVLLLLVAATVGVGLQFAPYVRATVYDVNAFEAEAEGTSASRREAVRLYTQAAAEWAKVGEFREEAGSLDSAASAAWSFEAKPLEPWDQVALRYTASAAAYKRAGDRYQEADAIYWKAYCLTQAERIDEGIADYRVAANLYQKAQALSDRADALATIADLLEPEDDEEATPEEWKRWQSACRDAMQAGRDAGEAETEARFLMDLGNAAEPGHAPGGSRAKALEFYAKAAQVGRDSGAVGSEADGLWHQAHMTCAHCECGTEGKPQGTCAEASALYEQAAAFYAADENPAEAAEARCRQGECLSQLEGRKAEATAAFQRAMELANEADDEDLLERAKEGLEGLR